MSPRPAHHTASESPRSLKREPTGTDYSSPQTELPGEKPGEISHKMSDQIKNKSFPSKIVHGFEAVKLAEKCGEKLYFRDEFGSLVASIPEAKRIARWWPSAILLFTLSAQAHYGHRNTPLPRPWSQVAVVSFRNLPVELRP